MEDSKLQKLHETLKALAPKGKVGGLGFYAKAGHRSRRSAADGMPEDKRALYSFFVRAGDGPSGHTHFADEGDKKLKKKKKKKKTKAPPPPSSDDDDDDSSEEGGGGAFVFFFFFFFLSFLSPSSAKCVCPDGPSPALTKKEYNALLSSGMPSAADRRDRWPALA